MVANRQYQPLGIDDIMPVHCRVVLIFESPDFPRSSEKVLEPQLWEALKDHVASMPSLQARRDDILPLVEFYLERYAREWNQPRRELTASAERMLKRYRWPGNVKELGWALASAMTSTAQTELDLPHFPPQIATTGEAPSMDNVALEDFVEQKLAQFLERVGNYDVSNLYEAIETQMERPLYKLMMQHTGGNQIKAARILGINRNTLRTKLKKYGLK
jgi:DNA-binding NtrC family response regulator